MRDETLIIGEVILKTKKYTGKPPLQGFLQMDYPTFKETLKPFTGAICVFTGAVFFSGKAILVKLGLAEGVGVMTLLNLRMLFSLPFFLAMLFYKQGKSERISIKDHGTIILLGICGYYLASYFDFAGLQYISASLERLIVFIYPTLVVILSALFFKTRIGKKELIALGLTYSGIMIAFVSDAPTLSAPVVQGSLLVFASAFTYAIYLIGSGRLIPKIGASKFTGYAMLVSTIAVLAHSVATDDLNLITSAKVYIIGLLMAIFCTVIPAILLATGIRLIGSDKASIIGSIGPVSTIALAAIFLNEHISFAELVGTCMVIAGVLLVSRQKQQALPPQKLRQDLPDPA